jgi:hypothetical protein
LFELSREAKMARGGAADEVWNATTGNVIAACCSMISGAVGTILGKKFPVLGDYSELVGLLLMGSAGFYLVRLFLQRRQAKARSVAGVVIGKRPAVLLASLAGDAGNFRQIEVDRAVRRIFEGRVDVLVWPESMPTLTGSKARRDDETRILAEQWLDQTRCHAVIFGMVNGRGATHLSIFSRSAGVEEIRGLAGEILELDAEFSDRLAQHIATQIAQRLIGEAANLLSIGELDSLIGVVDGLLPSVSEGEIQHMLISTRASALIEKAQRLARFDDFMRARNEFVQLDTSLGADCRSHLWGETQLNIAICDVKIGILTANRALLEETIGRLEHLAGAVEEIACVQCRTRAANWVLNARCELLKAFWDADVWRQSLDLAASASCSIGNADSPQFWDARLLEMHFLAIGIGQIDEVDDWQPSAMEFCDEVLLAGNDIPRLTRRALIGVAAVIQDKLFRRLGDRAFGTRAVELLDEQLTYLSREDDTANWIELKINKCIILALVAKDDHGPLRLRRAAECGEDALELLCEESGKREFARAVNATATAYDYLARRDMNAELFDIAAEYYARAALAFARLRLKADWATSRMNLSNVQTYLAEIRFRAARTDVEAAAALECFAAAERHASLLVRQIASGGTRADQLVSLNNLAFTQGRRGWTTGELEFVERAIATCREGLLVADHANLRAVRKHLLYNLTAFLFNLGGARKDASTLSEARQLAAEYVAASDSDPDNRYLAHARDIAATAPDWEVKLQSD